MNGAISQPATAVMVLIASFNGPATAYAAPSPEEGVYRVNILDYGSDKAPVDRTGVADDSAALAKAIAVANIHTSVGKPGCVYIPAGRYRIVSPPPSFAFAGCVTGDGSSQTFIDIDPAFSGDLFTWSEAWTLTIPGPRIVGLTVQGSEVATEIQNAFVFFDRNDAVFMEDVAVNHLHGRALYSGITKHKREAYMRDSHLISLHFFNDGAPEVPVVEFSSEGSDAKTDATNEIRMSLVDIYGAVGPSFVIRNNGIGTVRDITLSGLRIEGLQQREYGPSMGDLLRIGDPVMTGNVNNIRLTDVELINPDEGYCGLRMTAPSGYPAPYQITFQGFVGGGDPFGQGLCINAGRTSVFRLSGIYTLGTNVVIGPGVSQIVLDGGGQEAKWTYSIDPTSRNGVRFPSLSMTPGPL
jgi:hypothetical protein